MTTETAQTPRRARRIRRADTLTITDNRTGKTYEVPIEDGTIRAIELRQIKVDDDDFGLMTYDPAFMNTASCRSPITFIDGDKGILEYRGYPIEQLAEQSSYLEVAYLLIHGELPTQARARRVGSTRSRTTRSSTRTSRSSCRASATTRTRWGCSLASVGALSTFYPEAKQIKDHGAADDADRAADREDADARRLRLPAQPRACRTSTRTTTSATPATSCR